MIQSTTLYLLLLSAPLLYVAQLAIDFRRGIKAVGNFRGFRHLLSPATVLANIIPVYIPGIATGRNQAWNSKYKDFEYYGTDIFTVVSAWPRARVMINVADPAAVKEITLWRAKWVKPIEQYAMIMQFGRNIVSTEGDEWKKHRKIANPAFSEASPNNRLVWDESVRITLDMIDNVWENKEEVVIDHAVDITLSIALLIIGSAGFGRKISFSEDRKVPPGGYTMSFKDALHVVSTDMILYVIVPKWAMNLTERLRRVRSAFLDLQKYMQAMIDDRKKAEKKVERHDLFSSLLDANQDEAGTRLEDSELIGNIFIFLLAGHETTAHTLCFTFGLLALYQDQQEILYQHIMSVLPDKRVPTYEDMNSLSYVVAVFYETLRLFPPVTTIPKKSAEDTTLVTTNAAGERFIVPVPKGANVTLHTPGLHYNPRYWKDPHEFRPQRFTEDWPRDAFLPFSGGARSCIGRRFSETEATPILAILLARYRVEIKDEPQFAAETFAQRRERILALKPGITSTPIRVPLVFKRR
ncbi:614/534 cytochrome P450 [Phellopilus nigrolimitatus]|nr:614/534 cytochrome P450 [Phellopilus nigrolimitatus]